MTLSAHSNPGYFFQSWSGDVTSPDSVFTFTMNHNVAVTAISETPKLPAAFSLIRWRAADTDISRKVVFLK